MPDCTRFTIQLALVTLALPLASGASAQETLRRPKLPDGADTNDAAVYYRYGSDMLREKPRMAEQAFYWAHRLSPDWPDPLYARWVAALLSRSGRLPEYLDGNRGVVTSKEYRAIDSLYYAALGRNPFIFRRFDAMLFDEYIEIFAQRYRTRTGASLDHGALRYEFDREVLSSPSLRGWLAYAGGRWDEAIQAYTSALRGARYKAGLLASRARAAFLKGDYAAALADMTAALEERRKTEDKDLVSFYDSKAVFEHSIGVIHEFRKDYASAREAYARALQEDLSYHQGHVRLAVLALAGGDTATAISEYDLAAQIRGNDPVVRYQLGTLLAAQGRHQEAVEHLKAAIAAEPVFASSYLALGQAYDALSQRGEALPQYEAFVARARRGDPGLPAALSRREALRQEARP